MKARLAGALWLVGVFAAVPAVGGTVPKEGWPICQDRDELKEYFMAMIKNDGAWLKSLKSCGMAKPGLNLVTIEEYESDSDLGNVAKVRLIGDGSRKSVVGYTLKFKDGPNF